MLVQLALMMLGLLCRLLSSRKPQGPAKQSLKSMTQSLLLEFVAIALVYIPGLGAFVVGYVVSGFKVFDQPVYPRLLSAYFFFEIYTGILVPVPLNLAQAIVKTPSWEYDLFAFLGSCFSVCPEQSAIMVLRLGSCLLVAKQHIEEKKEQLLSNSKTAPAAQPAQSENVGWEHKLLVQHIAPFTVAVCRQLSFIPLRNLGSSIHGSGTSVQYLAFLCTLDICSNYFAAMSLLQIVLDQVKLVQSNVQALQSFVDETLPVQAHSDEPIEMQAPVSPGETFKVLPSFETGLVPVRDREVLESPLTTAAGRKAWWAEWHFMRVDFCDEQLALDALLCLCGVTISFNGIFLLILGLTASGSNDAIHWAFSFPALFLTALWSILFAALSLSCIEANNIHANMLTRIRVMITQEWREKGEGNIAMLEHFRSTVEAEGPPHTFLGHRLSLSLVLTACAPLLTASATKIFVAAQDIQLDAIPDFGDLGPLEAVARWLDSKE